MQANMMDIIFPVCGSTVRWDHSYALYGSLCRHQPLFHENDYPIGIFPVNGLSRGNRTLALTDKSNLRLRISASRIPDIFCLVGVELELDGSKIKLAQPKLEPIIQTSRLYSPWVTYTRSADEATFLSSLREEIARKGINAQAQLVQPINPNSKDGGKGSRDNYLRRTRSIKGKKIIGYALIVENLSNEDSAKICNDGLGGRRHFGGGLFLPARNRP